MFKSAIVGCGFIHGTHRNAYAQLEKEGLVKLVALCDVRKEKLTELPSEGLNLYTDIDEMLDKEELDMVSLCVPTYLHKELSIKCMKKGVHVLCEKPMALQYEDCVEMMEVSKETSKYLMIAHCVRFGRVLRVIKDLKSGDSTMIVVTHEMEFARNVSDKVIFMADGVIEEFGTPEEVFLNPKSQKTRSFLNKDIETNG